MFIKIQFKVLLSLLMAMVVMVAVIISLRDIQYVWTKEEGSPSLRDYFSGTYSGWSHELVSLGSTESNTEIITGELQLDDYVQVQFYDGSEDLLVYIAYWEPGKVNYKEISRHYPDRCWVKSGFDMVSTFEGSASNGIFNLGSMRKQLYRKDGISQHVWYAQLYGKQVFGVNTERGGVVEDFKNILSSLINLSAIKDQYFVRFSSSADIESEKKKDLVEEIIRKINAL